MDIDAISRLDNDGLRSVLVKNGIDAGPVNELTRKVYLNKLARLAQTKLRSIDNIDGPRQASAEPVAKPRVSQSIGEYLEGPPPDCSSTPAVGFKNTATSKSQLPQQKGVERNQNQNQNQNQIASASPRKAGLRSESQATRRNETHTIEPETPAEDQGTNETFTVVQRGTTFATEHQTQSQIPVSTPWPTSVPRNFDTLNVSECDSAKRAHLSEFERDALRNRLSQAIRPRKPIDQLGVSFDHASEIIYEQSYAPVVNGSRLEPALRHVAHPTRRAARSSSSKWKMLTLALFVIAFCTIAYFFEPQIKQLATDRL